MATGRELLWTRLRTLRAEIDQLSAGQFDNSDRQRRLIRLLACAVSAELTLESRQEAAAEDAKAWQLPEWVRRDCEPHRSEMLKGLGLISLFAGLASFFFVPALVAVGVGISVLVMAKRDREKMRNGLMDPRGEGQLRVAEAHAWEGILLGVAFVAFALLWIFMPAG